MLRTLLVLGRVSNLPTVWSDCLAAWLLCGGGDWRRFGLVCLGTTLLYTGGMFLNDAFDVEFDRRYRPERPILSGQVSLRNVWMLGFAWLLLGLMVIAPMGAAAAALGAALAGLILLYDAVHKRTVLAPVLMGGCRFLVYWVAASAAQAGGNSAVSWCALALGLYIVGLSYLARGESTGARSGRWFVPLLFAPVGVFAVRGGAADSTGWIVAVGQIAWVAWCLERIMSGKKQGFGTGVAGLLAGIVLVDWAAAAHAGPAYALSFIVLFALALALQKIVPAT